MGVRITWLTIISWLIISCPQYLYVSMTELIFSPRLRFKGHKIVLGACMGALLSTIGLFLPSQFRFVFCLLIYFSMPICFYRGRIAKKLLLTALWVVVFLVSESISVYIAPAFGWNVVTLTPATQLIFDAVCTVFILLIYLIVRGVMRIIEDRLDKRLWGRLAVSAIALLGSTAIILASLFTHQGHFADMWINRNIVLICGIGVFLPAFALLGLFMMIHELNDSIRNSEEARFMEAQARAELHRNQAMIAKDQQYRQLKHDIKNHLLVIDALGQKGEYERQRDYLSSLNEAFAQTEDTKFCAHPLIDILLESKCVRMQASGIEVSWNLRPVQENLRISDIDLCSLIGNIIDNAIEACERNAAEVKRWISIAIQADGNGLVFQVSNACPNPETVLSDMETRSRKRKNSAGIGLKAIRGIVNNYNGELLIRSGEDKASLVVSVYLPGTAKGSVG